MDLKASQKLQKWIAVLQHRIADDSRLDEVDLRALVKVIQNLEVVDLQLNEGALNSSMKLALMKLKGLLYFELSRLTEDSFQESLNWWHRKHGIFLDSVRKQQLQFDFADLKINTVHEAMIGIVKFKPKPKSKPGNFSIEISLKVWIKESLRLKYRLFDLLNKTLELSLESPLNAESNETFEGILPDPRSEGLIKIDIEDFRCKFRTHIEQDCKGELRNCCIQSRKEITLQRVALLLLDPDIYEVFYTQSTSQINLAQIAAYLSIDRHTFYSWWKGKKCKSVLQEFTRDFWELL
jgi:hypothetical protein